jgi:hypothetical protein
MSRYEMVAVIITVSMMGGTAMTLITSWFRYREKKLEVERRTPAAMPAQDDRLARIEQAVEAIAVEVERISEGQRFTTKLLAERQGTAAPLAAGERSNQWEERQHGR